MVDEARLSPVASAIKDPPEGLASSLRYLGPGLILTAAIVGSGELIATTVLGAKAGFALLWVILIGCLIKVTVQLQYGRHCILHGVPSFQAWKTSSLRPAGGFPWSILIAFLFLVSMFIGLAGVLGGASQVLSYLYPAVGVETWTVLVALSLALIVFKGRYRAVEIGSLILNLIFVAAIGGCVIGVQWTYYAFTWPDIFQGLSFRIPAGTLTLAAAAFGITGVGAAEIFTYPYWCLEKGYAAWTGPRTDSSEWTRRARGWIRVMTLDSMLSMVIYTLATCAFYLLGASVLSVQEGVADGNELVLQLSHIFTAVLGDRARLLFMLGAFAVLYSTVFANTAGYARLWTDLFTVCRLLPRDDAKLRDRSISIMSWVLPTIWALVYLTYQRPLGMVVFMGIANSLFLIVVAYKALVFRYRYTEDACKPTVLYDLVLWMSVTSILFLAAWGVFAGLG